MRTHLKMLTRLARKGKKLCPFYPSKYGCRLGNKICTTAVELAAEMQAIGQAIGKTLKDDISSAELQWTKDFASEVGARCC